MRQVDTDPRDAIDQIGEVSRSGNVGHDAAMVAGVIALCAVELRRIYELLDAQARAERAEGE